MYCENQLNEPVNNTSNPKSFWEKLKFLTSKKTHDTNLNVEDMEVHFKTLFKSDSDDLNQIPVEIDQDNIDDIEGYIFNSEITDEEIVNSIKALKESKSPGPDNLPPVIFIHSYKAITPLLTRYYLIEYLIAENFQMHGQRP